MSSPLAPLAVAQVIARNLVPLAGILFLGWNTSNVLLLYYADTLFACSVIAAGVLRHFNPPPEAEGWAGRVNAEAGALIGGLFVGAILALPLGVPLLFMLGDGFEWRAALADPELRAGVLWQAVAAWWSYAELYRALLHRTPDELRLKRRFALLFLRWMALVIAAGTGLGPVFGSWGALVFVALYAGLSVWVEIAPDRFLRLMPGGADHADPAPPAHASRNPSPPKRR
jgi:hypothetical protein